MAWLQLRRVCVLFVAAQPCVGWISIPGRTRTTSPQLPETIIHLASDDNIRHRTALAVARRRVPEMSVASIVDSTRASRSQQQQQQQQKQKQSPLTSFSNQTSIIGHSYSRNDESKPNLTFMAESSDTKPLGINQTDASASAPSTARETSESPSSLPSLARATEHVKGILQLYDESLTVQQSQRNPESPASWGLLQHECVMYADIVLAAFHDIIQSHLQEYEQEQEQHLQQEQPLLQMDQTRTPPGKVDVVLEQVDHLLTEFSVRGENHESGIFLLIPPTKTLHALWRLHQCRYRHLLTTANQRRNASGDHAQLTAATTYCDDFEMYISSCVAVLRQWHQWADMSSSTINDRYFSPPPVSYLVQLIEATQNCRQALSDDLWLYYHDTIMASLLSKSSSRSMRPPPRHLFTNLLLILSSTTTNPSSTAIHLNRYMHILRNLVSLATESRSDTENYSSENDYWPTHDEFVTALRHAAAQGQAQDAAWILRGMMLADHYQTKGNFLQTSKQEGLSLSSTAIDRSKNSALSKVFDAETMDLYLQALGHSDQAIKSGYWTQFQKQLAIEKR